MECSHYTRSPCKGVKQSQIRCCALWLRMQKRRDGREECSSSSSSSFSHRFGFARIWRSLTSTMSGFVANLGKKTSPSRGHFRTTRSGTMVITTDKKGKKSYLARSEFGHQNLENNFFQYRHNLMLQISDATDSLGWGNVFKKLKHCSIIICCCDTH